jgi:DNA invertase Pin-like site-specific DNA recombinase
MKREGDTLLVESVDRLSRLTQSDFNILKGLKDKGLNL